MSKKGSTVNFPELNAPGKEKCNESFLHLLHQSQVFVEIRYSVLLSGPGSIGQRLIKAGVCA